MRQHALRSLVRYGLKPVLQARVPLRLQRLVVQLAARANRLPAGTELRAVAMNGVPGEQLLPATGPARGVLLYFHGGGYCLGSPATHRALAARLAAAAGLAAYLPDYRLAPEHPFPAAIDDALQAYLWLLDSGHGADRIALAGDSAGGGLALALAARLRDEGLPLPAALALISPATDLSLSGTSIRERAAQDPMLSRDWIDQLYGHYAGNTPRQHPLLSPLFADLRGLPPMLIHVGSDEILLSDSLRLAEQAASSGVTVQLHEFAGLWHEFHVHAPMLPEATAAIAELGAFLRRHLAQTRSARPAARKAATRGLTS